MSRLRVAAAALIALGACKGKSKEQEAAPAPVVADAWVGACAHALTTAAKLTPVRRVQAILDGCRPCGDWAPLLHWNKPAADGGPATEAMEATMIACKAYCSKAGERAFLGPLEESRGKSSRKPWRELGEACGAAVSAVPDARYLSAPYFALDRIARAAAAQPALLPLLGALELPLPPIAMTGASFVLAASPVTKPEAGPVHVTVSMTELQLGTLPRAKLGAAGVIVEAGAVAYPGTAVPAGELAAAIDKLAADRAQPIAILAPAGMAAGRLVDVVEAAGAGRTLVLAVEAAGAPEGWHLPGTVPVALGAAAAAGALRLALGASPDDTLREVKAATAAQLTLAPVLVLDPAATVAGVAKLLGALAYRNVAAVALTRAP